MNTTARFACALFAVHLANGCAQSPAASPDMTPAVDSACAYGHAVDGGCDSTIAWAAAGSLAPGRDHHATFVANAQSGPFLFVIGGTDHYSSYILDDVQRAPIHADGTLGAWTKLSPLPGVLAGQAVAVVDDTIVLAGGVTEVAGHTALTRNVLVAHLTPDGDLPSWTMGPPIATAREHLSTVVQGRTIYLAGGLVGTDGTTDVERSTVGSDGTLSPWQQQAPLPLKVSHHAAVAGDGAVWLTGGLQGDPNTTGTSIDLVLRAPILDDGTLGAWQTAGHLPAPLCVHSSSVFGGFMYVFGGIESDTDFTANVRRATISADGTLGPWLDATPLPRARGHVLETPIWNGTVYSVGGSVEDLSVLTDVVIGQYQ